jgi:phosphate starvation-inducible PhoH-like protein
VISLVKEGQEQKISEIAHDVVCITAKGKPIKAKTLDRKNMWTRLSIIR